jgi:hypothetical protein
MRPSETPDPDLDPEGPDPQEMDSGDEPDLMPCPHCRQMITDETTICPHCQQPLDELLAPAWTLGAVVVVVLLILALSGLAVLALWRF